MLDKAPHSLFPVRYRNRLPDGGDGLEHIVYDYIL